MGRCLRLAERFGLFLKPGRWSVVSRRGGRNAGLWSGLARRRPRGGRTCGPTIRTGSAADLEQPHEAGVTVNKAGGEESGTGYDGGSRQVAEDPPGGSCTAVPQGPVPELRTLH